MPVFLHRQKIWNTCFSDHKEPIGTFLNFLCKFQPAFFDNCRSNSEVSISTLIFSNQVAEKVLTG